MDPIDVLDSDYIEWAIRVQAANYYNDQVNKQQQKQKDN